MVLFLSTLLSCERDVNIDLPEYMPKIVVDGRIETGTPALVFLSRSSSFFGTSDVSVFENNHVSGATVVVTDGTTTDTLLELCSQSLPPGMDTVVAEFLGIDVQTLQTLNICAYVGTDPALFGQFGTTYKLTIDHDTNHFESVTRIPEQVALDTTWFQIQQTTGSYGFAWATLSDPDTLGNGYRWYSRRLNIDTTTGRPKDNGFLAPIGSAFDDEFINGQTFDFAYDRPRSEGDDDDDRPGYFQVGDTIAIKYCTIERNIVDFLRLAESQSLNNGSPFATPANLPSNISGGALGLWAGYGVTYDTIIATQ